jgi:uroporphyrinogen decarboxylase
MKGGLLHMTSRERVKKALNFEEFDRVPVECGISGMHNDILYPDYTYGKGRSSGTPGVKGSSTDSWGCIWECGEDGVKGEVKHPILTDWSLLDSFKPPMDMLKEADLSRVNRQCELTDKFVMHMWCIDPFQRMQYLRGTENLFMDLAYGDIEVFKLRDMVHEFHLKEVEMWANTDVDAIHLEDDWGTQLSLLISPKLWREFFKPIYKDYCDIAHSKGKYVVMHSDGNITDIIPDMIEIGINAVNAQIDCMNVESLAEKFHGKMAFWGGFDRQNLLPFGTTEEVRNEVRRIANAFFKYKRTGVIGQCFKDKGHKDENIISVYDEWSKL